MLLLLLLVCCDHHLSAWAVLHLNLEMKEPIADCATCLAYHNCMPAMRIGMATPAPMPAAAKVGTVMPSVFNSALLFLLLLNGGLAPAAVWRLKDYSLKHVQTYVYSALAEIGKRGARPPAPPQSWPTPSVLPCLYPSLQGFSLGVPALPNMDARCFSSFWCVPGAHSSTVEVEHELMDLWNAVEKDKVVQAARRAAAARSKTRMEPAQPPLKKVQLPMLLLHLPSLVEGRSKSPTLSFHHESRGPQVHLTDCWCVMWVCWSHLASAYEACVRSLEVPELLNPTGSRSVAVVHVSTAG